MPRDWYTHLTVASCCSCDFLLAGSGLEAERIALDHTEVPWSQTCSSLTRLLGSSLSLGCLWRLSLSESSD